MGHLHYLGPIAQQSFDVPVQRYGSVMQVCLGSVLLMVVSSANMTLSTSGPMLAIASRSALTVTMYLDYNHAYFALAPFGPNWMY
ncbi:hypothetical protein AMTR_s00022p00226170 [Amborella trichopoda]|uniref:Uncharacterized protein n=1 Tax=Amborella trichopoda TaxID=13333 RepID=W1PVI1_AMBTC|nr:hypothetical protein AMTR_s00022p00226170 [Amborella trichopoda]